MTKTNKDSAKYSITGKTPMGISCWLAYVDFGRIDPRLSLDQQLRIVLFDDSIDAIYTAEEEWTNYHAKDDRANKKHAERDNVILMAYKSPELETNFVGHLIRFCPNIIVTDLVKGISREDGYNLIRQLQNVPDLKKVPICVVSSYISDNGFGLRQKERALSTPGVVGAYGKFQGFPSLEVLMIHARPYMIGGK